MSRSGTELNMTPNAKFFEEVVVHEFDRNSVSNEVLQIWRDKEVFALKKTRRTRPTLPPSIRDPVIRKMEQVLEVTGSLQNWYSAVSLLDVYSFLFDDDRLMADLPLTCMAVLQSVSSINCNVKSNRRDAIAAKNAVYAGHATEISQWLYRTGHTAEALTITATQLRKQEELIFKRLQGIHALPTAHEWLWALFARLNMLTQAKYKVPIKDAGERCSHLLRLCMLKQDTSEPNFLPSRIACGLLAHSLVAVRLVPVDTLQPPCATRQEWETLFAASQPEGVGAKFPCMLTPKCSEAFMPYVEVYVCTYVRMYVCMYVCTYV